MVGLGIIIIKQPCSNCTSLPFSSLTLMMTQKFRLVLVKFGTNCYHCICQLPFFTDHVQLYQDDPFGNQENLLNIIPATLARTVSCGVVWWRRSCSFGLARVSATRNESLVGYVPNFLSLFRCLGHTRLSVQVRGFVCEHFITWYIFTVRSC